MLQMEGPEWVAGFGGESTKPLAQDDRTVKQQTGLATSSTFSRHENGKGQPSTTRQGSITPNSIIPLKRSRDDRDREGARTQYQTKENSMQAPMSPPNLRQAFVPDRGDHWSPNARKRPDSGSLSPQYRRRSERGDRWVPSERHSSPLRRPSPVRRRSPEYNEWPRQMPKPSPENPPRLERDRRDSHSREVSTVSSFKNLTWKAPELESRPSVNVPKIKPQTLYVNGTVDSSVASQSADTAHSRVDFNGLKGVPTGPKQVFAGPSADRSKVPNRILPTVDVAIKRLPHIFISAECVPAKVQTAKHLHGFFRKYILRESDVRLDESGWYLCFEDTETGRERLQLCYEHHNRAMFFNMYTLIMEPFPDGQPMPRLTSPATVNGIATLNITDVGGHPPPAKATVDAQTFLDNLDVSRPSNGEPEDVANSVPGLHAITTDLSMNGTANSPLPPEVMIRYLQRSSPLSMPSRHDKDETSSSISGITNSDMSVTKRLKCHVCQASTNFDTDALIHCSSCPRRYHRRCHTQPAIPSNIGPSHFWQCRRCVKKKIQPKSRLSNASPAAASSPAASVGQPEGPPSKKLRLDAPRQSWPLDSSLVTDDLNSPSRSNFIDAASNQAIDHNEPTPDAEDSYEPTDLPIVNSDERNLFEANDLVAKSFASLEAQSEPFETSEPKSEKLNLIRKKGFRAEEISAPRQPGKPHKWSGGGADKHIIEAGKNFFFQENHSPQQGFDAAQADALHPQPVIDAVATAEIPESPAQISRLGLDGNDSPTNMSSTEPHAGESVKKHTKGSGFVSKLGVHANVLIRKPGPAAQRMKPGMPNIARCVKCQKKIAYRPSGTNRFCSRCKQEASGELELTPWFPESTAQKAEKRNHRYSPIEEAEPTDSETQAKAAFQTPPVPAIETDTLGRYGSNRPAQTESREACDKCRKKRKRCTHNTVVTALEPGLAVMRASPNMNESQVGGDGSEDDLDFWKTKPLPKTVNNDLNHKILSRNMAPNGDGEASADSVISPTNEENPHQRTAADLLDKSDAVTPQAKRQSQTRPPNGAHDLGDSFTRPPNTYVKLIGMALCSAPNHRLKGNDIVHWVTRNIPTYKAGLGKWENSLRATMTLKREGYGGGEGLWKIVDDGSKKNQGFMYELLPGKAETMLHWDPVLGMPVSPPKGWRMEREERSNDVERGVSGTDVPTGELPETPPKALGTRRKRPVQQTEKQRSLLPGQSLRMLGSTDVSPSIEAMEIQSMGDTDDSSDDEPLARTRRKSNGAHAAVATGSRGDSVENSMAEFYQSPDASDISKTQPSKPPIQRSVAAVKVVPLLKVVKPTLEEVVLVDSKNADYSAKSLFDEWPEYDPQNAFDREAKIAEIKRRPTRKQRFGKQDSSVEMETSGSVSRNVFSGNNLSPQRSKRMNRATAYPWEVSEENLIQCDSVEELFGLPANPIAIIHDGDIAYRDGSKNYSRVVYKSGYA